jgi:beta-glucosidase
LAAAHHLLLAHGRTLQLYRQLGYHGEIGIVLNLATFLPKTDQLQDIAAAKRLEMYLNDTFLEPLFKGEYPQDLKSWMGEMWPEIHPGDLAIISQPIDFLGVNYYFSNKVSFSPHGLLKLRTEPNIDPGWGITDKGWGVCPSELITLLTHLKEDYGNPPIFITENGTSLGDSADETGFVNDQERINYLEAHFEAAHRAITKGVDLRGYYVWSLMDNFEWAEGYDLRFGLIRVDFADPKLKRTPKASFSWYQDVIRNNGFCP